MSRKILFSPLFFIVIFVTFDAYGDSHNIPPISVSTSLPTYDLGDTILINGSIKYLEPYEQAVTIIIKTPHDAMVYVGQAMHDSEGNFHHVVKTGGLMSSEGNYEIQIQYGPAETATTFYYIPEGLPPDSRGVKIETDRISYKNGNELTVTGKIFPIMELVPI